MENRNGHGAMLEPESVEASGPRPSSRGYAPGEYAKASLVRVDPHWHTAKREHERTAICSGGGTSARLLEDPTQEQKLMAQENPYHQHILIADDGDGFTYRHAHIEHFLPHTHEPSEVMRQLNAGELRLWRWMNGSYGQEYVNT